MGRFDDLGKEIAGEEDEDEAETENENMSTEAETDTETETEAESETESDVEKKGISGYIDVETKDEFDRAYKQIQTMCNLADEPKPRKTKEFLNAVILHGSTNLPDVAGELGLSEAYEKYGETVEAME